MIDRSNQIAIRQIWDNNRETTKFRTSQRCVYADDIVIMANTQRRLMD